VDAAAVAGFETLLGRRLAREPVSRILGRRAFWTLDLVVTPDTLDPRPDSETLIEAALAAFADRAPPRHVIDLGTGTGCLLLAVLSEFPDATGLGVDRLAGAVSTARENAHLAGLADRAVFVQTDWDDLPHGQADLILSNPPYIADQTLARLEPEVALFDPPGALAGGADGLSAYRSIFRKLPSLLAREGVVILELGAGQRQVVEELGVGAGLTVQDVRHDLAGIERALVLKWNDTGDDCLNTNDFCLE
jgi:release factor glutamine methyltransferase